MRSSARPSLGTLLRRSGEFGPGLVLQTFLLLLSARIALKWLPVAKIIAWKQRPLPAATGLNVADLETRCRQVRQTVLAVARNSPIDFVCFPQCLAAAALLRSRGIATRLHYGVTRSIEKPEQLSTHTWLEANGEILIGGEVAEQFSTLAVY